MTQRTLILCLALLTPTVATAETVTLTGKLARSPATCTYDTVTHELSLDWKGQRQTATAKAAVGQPVLIFRFDDHSGAARRIDALGESDKQVISLALSRYSKPLRGRFLVDGRLRGWVNEPEHTFGAEVMALWRSVESLWKDNAQAEGRGDSALGLPSVAEAKAACASARSDAALREAILALHAAYVRERAPGLEPLVTRARRLDTELAELNTKIETIRNYPLGAELNRILSEHATRTVAIHDALWTGTPWPEPQPADSPLELAARVANTPLPDDRAWGTRYASYWDEVQFLGTLTRDREGSQLRLVQRAQRSVYGIYAHEDELYREGLFEQLDGWVLSRDGSLRLD